MKKILIFLAVVYMLFGGAMYVHAGYDETSIVVITEDKTIEYDKRELLEALYEADISTIREALDMRLITSRELTEYYLERIELYNDSYNCFITLCDNALEEADKRDAMLNEGAAKGKLWGIPVVVKDNIEYAGYYTTNGRKFEDSSISEVNATIVEYLLNEGAVIIGKSNMSTDAQDARASRSKAVGETLNAYNTELASGGSSGGSAVATSLNFITASVGTDTNSSLRYPAALNGCVSLRPTKGLISKDGIIKLNGARDTAGAITRTVKDQAIMLDVLTEGKYAYADNLNGDVLQGMRIGVLKELTYPVSGKSGRTAKAIDDEIEIVFANAVKELEACGATVIEVSMPDVFSMAEACDEDFEDYKTAKSNFYEAFKALLTDNDIDAVIFPTYLTAPLYTGVNESGGLVIYTQPYTTNCKLLSPTIGLPEISVPIGQHSRGAGIGMEIASLKNSEQLLLDIAYSYTEKYNHRAVPVNAPDIYAEYDAGSLNDFIIRYKGALAEVERLKAEEQREQETTTQEIETTTEQETTTTVEVTTTLGESAVSKETTAPTVETSTFMKDVLADYNADEDNLGKILWIIFIMLIVLVAVANFIILYHEDDKKRRKK